MQAICLDIDGTLLSSKGKILKETKEALLQSQAQGIRLILASGRPTQGVLEFAQELEMDQHHGLCITYNGSQALDVQTHEILFNEAISKEECKAVLHHLKQFDGLTVMIDHGAYMCVEDVYRCMVDDNGKPFNIMQYEARAGHFLLKEVPDLEATIDFPVNKILTFGNHDYLEANHQAMAEPFPNLSAMFTAYFYFEFTVQGVDKAKALRSICAQEGIDLSKVIAFGDGQNDCSLLETCGYGVAMGNADEKCKAIANACTCTNDENGIAKFLRERGIKYE